MIAGFRNIEKLYPTRKIRRGDQVYSLPIKLLDFSDFKYTISAISGEKFTIEDYMTRNNVAGLLIIKNNHIVLERYALGNTATSRWISFSVAKSVVSLLTGAAIKDGYIRSIDDKVTDYIPHLKGSSYEDVSIRNVLQMASGVKWNEDYADPQSDVNKTLPYTVLDLLRFLGTKPRESEPGRRFNYNTGETSLMGAVLRSAIGNNLSTYLSDKIWVPFGMESVASWMLHSPGGGEIGGCCINATLRDYGHLGLFAMNGGVLADGTRILPEEWMEESTRPSKGNRGYGYFWWIGENFYQALGVFGQLIHINPDQKLVIAAHSAFPTAVSPGSFTHQMMFVRAVTSYLQTKEP
jgi:CubicO group peptidase (beta-lactamase class C family)